MSQRTVLIALTFAIILAMCQTADAKRKRQQSMDKNIRSKFTSHYCYWSFAFASIISNNKDIIA